MFQCFSLSDAIAATEGIRSKKLFLDSACMRVKIKNNYR